MPLPTIMVHSGARTIASDEIDANQSACLVAIKAGWMLLRYGGSAKDAVEAAIRSLEFNPTFNSGITASRNSEDIFFDAALMEGDRLRWGAVAGVQQVRHPISVARKLLDQQPMLLVGKGAERFAVEQGCELYELDGLVTAQNQQPQQRDQSHLQASKRRDTATSTTMGCVALDATGLLVAGTLAGGTQTDSGVGSTVVIGSGLYASRIGACVTSGDGGSIMTVTLAKTAVDLLTKSGYPEIAAQGAIQSLEDQIVGKAGCILLNHQGQMGWTHNSEHMPVAYRTAAMDKAVFYLQKPIERPFNLLDEFNPFHF